MNTLEMRTRLYAAVGNRYQIARTLGETDATTVYLARDVGQSRDVAIKVLKSTVSEAVGVERFSRAMRLAATLEHPNILPIYDVGDTTGMLFYVTPNVERLSLREDMDASGPLPAGDVIRVAGEVAEALDYAHRHGVVHRHLTPANIVLRDGRALVGDFGIGTALSEMDQGGPRSDLSMGTPAYTSPEQAAGEPGDERSDVYALACVLYEMLVGEPPFTGPTSHVVMSKRFVHTPPSVSAVRDGIPRSVAHALQRGLARSPDDRPQSPRAFARALSEVEKAPASVASGESFAAP